MTKKEIQSVKKSQNLLDSAQESLVYENAKPAITTFADGTALMTYLDDTEENSGGQTTLMYRLYQNGAWSDGKPVDKTEPAGYGSTDVFSQWIYLCDVRK